MILRSKITWAEEGEKNSAFFLNLEKNNYVNKHITQLNVNGKIITNAKEILEEEKVYYKSLYNENDTTIESERNISSLLNNIRIPKLTTDDSNHCELRVDETECLACLKKLKNGKTPGIDGLPPDFYKFFWSELNEYLVNAINYAFKNGELSTSQKIGITLIPKKWAKRP